MGNGFMTQGEPLGLERRMLNVEETLTAYEDCFEKDQIVVDGKYRLCSVDYYHPNLFNNGFECRYSGGLIIPSDTKRFCRLCYRED